MFSLRVGSSLSLEGGVSVDTFFPFSMRQVGVKSSSSSVRLVKRHGAGDDFWIAMLATPSSELELSSFEIPLFTNMSIALILLLLVSLALFICGGHHSGIHAAAQY